MQQDALRAPAGVRARDVMFNRSDRQVQKKPLGGFFFCYEVSHIFVRIFHRNRIDK